MRISSTKLPSFFSARGKVSLDHDVRKYVPELPNFGQRITLEHLVHGLFPPCPWKYERNIMIAI
jgi:hypothetical protein